MSGDTSDPQTLNKYAYVRNDPLGYVDPSGMDHECAYLSGYCLGNEPGPFGGLSSHAGSSIPYHNIERRFEAEGGRGSPKPMKKSRLSCAADFGQNHSLAAAVGAQDTTLGRLLGGNSVSGAVDLGLSIFGGGPAPNPVNLIAGGASLGVPVNDALSLAGQQTVPGFTSATGTLRGAGLRALFNTATEAGNIPSIAAEGGEIALEGGITASEYASGVIIAKFVFDTATFGYGYFFSCGAK